MVWKCPNTAMKVRTIEIRPTFGQSKLEWIRHNKMAYDINERVNKVTYHQRKNRPHGLVSLSEHVENYPSTCSKISYGRTFINDRYHSIATLGQITFIFTVLGPSLNVPI